MKRKKTILETTDEFDWAREIVNQPIELRGKAWHINIDRQNPVKHTRLIQEWLFSLGFKWANRAPGQFTDQAKLVSIQSVFKDNIQKRTMTCSSEFSIDVEMDTRDSKQIAKGSAGYEQMLVIDSKDIIPTIVKESVEDEFDWARKAMQIPTGEAMIPFLEKFFAGSKYILDVKKPYVSLSDRTGRYFQLKQDMLSIQYLKARIEESIQHVSNSVNHSYNHWDQVLKDYQELYQYLEPLFKSLEPINEDYESPLTVGSCVTINDSPYNDTFNGLHKTGIIVALHPEFSERFPSYLVAVNDWELGHSGTDEKYRQFCGKHSCWWISSHQLTPCAIDYDQTSAIFTQLNEAVNDTNKYYVLQFGKEALPYAEFEHMKEIQHHLRHIIRESIDDFDWVDDFYAGGELVTKDNVYADMRVFRGPDWRYGNQGQSGEGTILRERQTKDFEDFWCGVQWDNGYVNIYRIGPKHFDLVIARSEAGKS